MSNPTTPPPASSKDAETLIRHAHKLLGNCGIDMSPSKVTRIVRDYKRRVEANGFSFEAFLVNSVELTVQERMKMLSDPEIARVISYADPTGELAVNNVYRAGRKRGGR